MFQIVINRRPHLLPFQASSVAEAVLIARKEASEFAERAFRYKGAYPNSVRVEYVPTGRAYPESYIVPQHP
jgi:hypothetical protein